MSNIKEIPEITEPVVDSIEPKELIEDPIEAPQEGEEVSKVIDEELMRRKSYHHYQR